MSCRNLIHGWWNRLPIWVMSVGIALSPVTRAGEPGEGSKFPDPAKFGLEGSVPSLSGKVAIVDFWASWCAPCRQSFPQLDALYQKYRAQGLVVVGISTDQDAKAMKSFLAANKVSFPVARDAGQKLVSSVSPSTMPTTFVIDGSGTVKLVEHGYHGKSSMARLESAIQKLLGKKS